MLRRLPHTFSPSSELFSRPLCRSMATVHSLPNPYPRAIDATEGELSSKRLSSQNLEIAVRTLHHDGLIVVNNVVPHSVLDSLNKIMVEDAYKLQSRRENSPYNYNRGNIQQDHPPVAQYFSEDIFLNPIASQITSTMLGPRPKWTFCSANVAMPPTPSDPPQRQPVHSDADFDHPNHPFGLVVNVPLVTMTEENGATEVWLGTHEGSGLHVQEGTRGERASGRIKEDVLEERRKFRGPSRPTIEKGAIVIRDLRLWHAGVGNESGAARVMLAMIHYAPWYRNPMRLQFAQEIKPLIESQNGLEIPVDWVSYDEVLERYLNRGFGNSYDFSQTA